MIGEIIIIRANGTRETRPVVDARDDIMLATLHDIVGGYIEAAPFFKDIKIDGSLRRCVVFCNEEGKLKQLPFNTIATLEWDACLRRHGHPSLVKGVGRYTDYLVGDIAVIVGDKLLRVMQEEREEVAE